MLAFVLFSVLIILFFRWIPVPFSSVMAQRQVNSWFSEEPSVQYQWTRWDNVSLHLPLSVIAAEDQNFAVHRGFDLDAIQKALEESREGRRQRGASTISQQVAKNLFLWNGRSWVRKGLEAWFTVLIEFFWPKKRILEVYLNIAEMGPNVFGAQAASTTYFKRTPDRLTAEQAALLAASLPNPRTHRVDRPSNYMRSRQAWIMRQIRQMGGTSYLDQL